MKRPSWTQRRWLVLVPVAAILLAVGCGGGGDDPLPTPAPTPTPVPKRVALVSYGYSGMLWAGSLGHTCDDIRMYKNILQTLAQRQTGIRVLYATDSACDPRTSSNYCQLVADPTLLQPFFNMINSIGSIEFKAYTSVDPYAYDVVILDCCRTNLTTIRDSVLRYINTAHGGIWVVGSNSCYRSGTASAQLANSIVQDYGMRFGTEDPVDRTCHSIPADKNTGILKDVASIEFFRLVPQTVTSPARSVIENGAGQPLIAVYERTD
jgi:hypothetical protein